MPIGAAAEAVELRELQSQFNQAASQLERQSLSLELDSSMASASTAQVHQQPNSNRRSLQSASAYQTDLMADINQHQQLSARDAYSPAGLLREEEEGEEEEEEVQEVQEDQEDQEVQEVQEVQGEIEEAKGEVGEQQEEAEGEVEEEEEEVEEYEVEDDEDSGEQPSGSSRGEQQQVLPKVVIDSEEDCGVGEARRVEARARRLLEENNDLHKQLDACRRAFLQYELCLRQVAEQRLKVDEQATELLRDRDQAVEDLRCVEKAFADLHRRFEKSKMVIEALKQNEDTLKKCLNEYQARLRRNEQKYHTLKAHAEEKLDAANARIEEQRRSSEAEIARLSATLRKSELRAQNLTAQMQQKEKENAELTSICDELIQRVSGNGL